MSRRAPRPTSVAASRAAAPRALPLCGFFWLPRARAPEPLPPPHLPWPPPVAVRPLVPAVPTSHLYSPLTPDSDTDKTCKTGKHCHATEEENKKIAHIVMEQLDNVMARKLAAK